MGVKSESVGLKSEEGIEPYKRPSPPPTGLQRRPFQVGEDTTTPEKEKHWFGTGVFGARRNRTATCAMRRRHPAIGPWSLDADRAVCRRGRGAASRPQTLFIHNLACSVYDCILDVFEMSMVIFSETTLPDAVDPCKGRTPANLLSPAFLLHQLYVFLASSFHRSLPFTCCRSVVQPAVCPLWGLQSCSRIPWSLLRRVPSPSSKDSRCSRFRPLGRSCIPCIFPTAFQSSVSGVPEGRRI